MNNQERKDLNKIRNYKGTVADFKSYWDDMAGKNTNAYNTPEYQGFNAVHPTRGAKQSPHWKTANLSEGVSKIACLDCDEVNTEKAWKKNNGVCPSCNTSTQGVAESLTEQDHEVKMAQGQLDAIINAAFDLKEKIGNVEINIPAWIQDHISQSYGYIKQANDGYHKY